MDEWQSLVLRFLCVKDEKYEGRNSGLLIEAGELIVAQFAGVTGFTGVAKDASSLLSDYSEAKYNSYPYEGDERARIEKYQMDSKRISLALRNTGNVASAIILDILEVDLQSPMPLAIYRLPMNDRYVAMEKAVSLCFEAVVLLWELNDFEPDQPLIRWCIAYFEEKQAEAHCFLREYGRARLLFETSLSRRLITRPAFSDPQSHLGRWGDAYLVQSHLNLARIARETHGDDAIKHVEDAEKKFRSLSKQSGLNLKQLQAYLLRTKASVLRGMNRLFDAEKHCREALELYEKLYQKREVSNSPSLSEEDPRTRLGYEVAVTHITLGGILSRQKRWEEARLYCELALGSHFLLPASVRRSNPQQKMRLLHHLGKIHLNLARDKRTLAGRVPVGTIEWASHKHWEKHHFEAAMSHFVAEIALYEELKEKPRAAYRRDEAKAIVRYADVLREVAKASPRGPKISQCLFQYQKALRILSQAKKQLDADGPSALGFDRPEILLDLALLHCRIGRVFENHPGRNSFDIAVREYRKCTKWCAEGLMALRNENRDFSLEKHKIERAYLCLTLVAAEDYRSASTAEQRDTAFTRLIALLETLRDESHVVFGEARAHESAAAVESRHYRELWEGLFRGIPASPAGPNEGPSLASLIDEASRNGVAYAGAGVGLLPGAVLYIQKLSQGRVLLVFLSHQVREVVVMPPNQKQGLETLRERFQESIRYEEARLNSSSYEDRICPGDDFEHLRRVLFENFPKEITGHMTSGGFPVVFVSACSEWMNIPFSLLMFESVPGVYVPLGVQTVFPRVHGLEELKSVLQRFPIAGDILVSDFAPAELPNSASTSGGHHSHSAAQRLEGFARPEDVGEALDALTILKLAKDCSLWYHVGHSCPPLRERRVDGLLLDVMTVLDARDIRRTTLRHFPIVHFDACETAKASQPNGGGGFSGLCHSAIRAGASAVMSNSHLVHVPNIDRVRSILYFHLLEKRLPVGVAVMETRRRLYLDNNVHPLIFSALTLYGNPWATFKGRY